MSKKIASASDCSGSECDWALVKHQVECVAGTGGCSAAYLRTAEESTFHDKNLVEATKKINRILCRIPADPDGRKLSLCTTDRGLFLSWVNRGGKALKSGVNRHSGEAKVRKALKLTD
jgi:hypothetical protein